MGRIADAALARLNEGPAAIDDLAERLASAGVTRAKNPVAAVRQALRADWRVLVLPDGRVASIAQAMADVALTAHVSVADHARGAVDLEADLAPLAVLGLARVVLPTDIRPGDQILVRVTDAVAGRVSVERAPSWLVASDAELALIGRVQELLERAGSTTQDARRVRLSDAFCEVAAADPSAFRRSNRPISDALRDVGLEIHLGWVAPVGTRWGALTELEIEALESGVADHLAADRPVEAAELQDRLVSVLRRHLPERVPAARRRLARVLARAGRTQDGLAVLTGAFGFDDPEDRYEACLLAIRLGDTLGARRWAEEGLARADGLAHAEVAACLDDLAGDLDAEAAYRDAQEWIPEISGRVGVAERLASQLLAPRRSYLVGALVEQVFRDVDEERAQAIIAELGQLGSAGRDACLACAAVLDGVLGRAAWRAAGGAHYAQRPWVQGLLSASPVDAWITSPGTDAAQQHLIIAVAKEDGRWAPLIVVIDHHELDGAARDAFFLNDLAEPRFRRELLRPISELGLPLRQVPVDLAVALLADALAQTCARGWKLPALEYQPVLARIQRFVLPVSRGSAPRAPLESDQ